jgi:truncated hemoglobin YjbI
MSEQLQQKSLYERLGGVYSIATVVDDFIDRIMVDPRLNSNPLGETGRLGDLGRNFLTIH